MSTYYRNAAAERPSNLVRRITQALGAIVSHRRSFEARAEEISQDEMLTPEQKEILLRREAESVWPQIATLTEQVRDAFEQARPTLARWRASAAVPDDALHRVNRLLAQNVTPDQIATRASHEGDLETLAALRREMPYLPTGRGGGLKDVGDLVAEVESAMARLVDAKEAADFEAADTLGRLQTVAEAQLALAAAVTDRDQARIAQARLRLGHAESNGGGPEGEGEPS